MGAQKLKQGSKGKLVVTLQKFLNSKGKLPKPIPENGDFGPETKEAVRYFQRKAGLKGELDGTVGPETAGALAKLVGPSAASFAKEFGEAEDADKKKEQEKAAEESQPKIAGKPGKLGNLEYKSGAYVISIPPNPANTFTLVLVFGGLTHIPPVYEAAMALSDYVKNAILVFSEPGGSFSAAQPQLKPLLAQTQTRIGAISVCGYSLGGQAAYRDYGHATKAVGLIDPTTYHGDLAKLDNKAIFSHNPDNWSEPKYASIVAAQNEAGTLGTAGVYEKTSVRHGAYPKYFLDKFAGKLL